ncbi:TetR/AcrR family transcriptional regulator [Clostridium estertheticum]|uniref:TetR/AcrR family transcriptional regulator n=1 Tax=Clostridium estertheticum TaxID=238834 RepID=UPI001652B130|nr:TetR/AcrR family transcriptional regulator [Clostridium estertheticum]MBZ9607906.1 TetR/AcrR family transcriptional regulator [Clostridium estertheticum]
MQTNKNRVTKEIILENTLSLIDERHGRKDVTLRDIAKKTGCAHTNLYNYFNGLDDIFWESLGKVLIMMMDYADNGISSKTNPKENFYLVLSNIIDFSMNHPGWYELIWLKSIGGTPSKEVIKILEMPSQGFTAGIMKSSNNKISEEKASLIGDILHSYLHGEVCKWIYNRTFIKDKEEIKIKILSNLKQLYELLINNN